MYPTSRSALAGAESYITSNITATTTIITSSSSSGSSSSSSIVVIVCYHYYEYPLLQTVVWLECKYNILIHNIYVE